MQRLSLVAMIMAAFACSTSVTPSNPYDNSTPAAAQAKGRIRGTLSAPGQAAAGIQVSLSLNNTVVSRQATAADGSFLFDNVEAATYLLQAQPAGYLPLAVPVTLAVGQDLDLQAVALSPAATSSSLSGVATLPGTSDSSGILVEALGHNFTAVTSPSGAWALTVTPGTYDLRFSHHDYKPLTVQGISVANGEEKSVAAQVLLANPAQVHGKVLGEIAGGAPAPLGAATVTLDGTSITGITDPQGTFTLTGVSPGSYVLRALKQGFDARTVPVLNLAGAEDRDATGADPLLLPLSRGGLAGMVLLSASNDGSGTAVTAGGLTVITGADGSFAFDTLLTGVYQVDASHAGYLPLTLAASATVQQGLVKQLGSFTLHPNPSSVSGLVTGELPAGGSGPLPGASVTLDNTSISAVTDGSGAFTLNGVPVGSYLLRVGAQGYTVATQAILSLQGGEARALSAPVALSLLRGSVAGTVALQGQSDASGVTVSLAGTALSQLTSQNGAFQFDGLLPGSYSVAASRAGWLPATLGPGLVTGASVAQLPLTTLPLNPGTILGHVDGENTSGGKTPLVGATISLEGSAVTATTAGTGDFALSGVAPGSYVVHAHAAGFVDATLPALNLLGGETRTLPDPFTLQLARGQLTGAVLLADVGVGGDQSGTVVTLTGTALATITAHDGSFVFAQLVAGTYEVTAHRDQYQQRVLGVFTVTQDSLAQAGSVTLSRQGGAISIAEAPATRSRGLHCTLSSTTATGYHLSEDASFADPAQGDLATDPWRPYQQGATAPFTLPDLDGQHTLYVQFFDGASTSAPSSASLVLDRVAPQNPRVVIGSGSGFTNAPGGIISLTLSAQDLPPAGTSAVVSGLSQVQIANNALFAGASTLPYSQTTTWTLDTPNNDGVKTVYVKFIDSAGNVSAQATASATLDTLAPASPHLGLAGPDATRPGYTASPIVTATLSATDANAGANSANLLVRLSNDPGFPGAVYQPFQPLLIWLLPPGDGVKTVYADFLDPAGNQSLVVSSSLTLLTHAPATPSLSIVENDSRPANGFTRVPGVSLVLSAGAGVKAAQVAEDPALLSPLLVDLSAVSLPFSQPWTLSGDGLHTVYARYLDAAGNASPIVSAQVTLDRVAPLALLPSVLPGSLVTTPSVQLLPPSAGEAELLVTGDLTPVQSQYAAVTPGVPVPITLTAGDGVKNLTVSWRDLADNVTTLAPFQITLDGTPPVAQAFNVAGVMADGSSVSGPAAFVSSPQVTLDLSAQADPSSGIKLVKLSNLANLSDAAWQPFTASTAVPFTLSSGDGVKTVYALFQDAAGNSTVTPVSGTIHLAATPPTQDAITIEGGAATTSKAAGASITLAMASTGAAQMAFSQDNFQSGITWLPFNAAAATNFTGADQQTRTVYARFRNAARVEGLAVQASIFWNHTPPSAAGFTLFLSGSLGSGLGASSTYTSAAGITAQLVPPASGLGYVTQMAFAQPASASCAGAFTAPSWQPYQPSAPLTLTGADGVKTVCVTFQDNAGNTNTASAALGSITLQAGAPTTGPIVIAGAHADGTADTALTATTSVLLDFSADTDALSGMAQMKVANGTAAALSGVPWQPYAKTLAWQVPSGDGPKPVFALFRNAAGNASASAVSGTITLDATPPGAPTLSVPAYSNTQTIPLTLSATGSPVSATVSENPSLAGGQTYAAPFTGASYAVAGTGPRVLYARFTDAAGNQSAQAAASVTVILPSQGPAPLPSTLTSSVGADPAGFATTTSVILTPPSAGQSQVKVTGGIAAPYGPSAAPAGVGIPLTLSGAEGLKTLSITYLDPAGNQTAAPAATITYDRTPPAAVNFTVSGAQADGTPVSGAGASVSSTAVTLNLSAQADAVSGIAQMKISNLNDLSDASWQPFNASAAFPWTLQAGDGAKTVYALFRDFAGNTNAAAVTGGITLAAAAPTAASVSLATGPVAARCQALTLAAAGAAEMAFSLNGFTSGSPAWVPYSVSASLDLLTGAPCTGAAEVNTTQGVTISVKFRNAGRVQSAAASASVLYDHVAPSAAGWTLSVLGSLIGGAPSTTLTSTASVSVQLTPPAAGVGDVTRVALVQAASCTGAFGSPSFVPYAATLPFAGGLTGADGTKRLCALFQDAAGNFDVTSFATGTTLLDTAAPGVLAFSVTGQLADGTASATTTASNAVTLDFSAQADAAGGSGLALMKLSNLSDLSDASWQPFVGSSKVPWFLLPGDGPKNVYALFQDAVGRVSAAAAVNATPYIQLAQTAPSGLSISGPAVSATRCTALSVAATGAAEMSFSLNGFTSGSPAWVPYAASPSVDLLTGAACTGAAEQNVSQQVFVSVRFRNAGRVQSGVASTTVLYDHLAPSAAGWAFAVQGPAARGTTSTSVTGSASVSVLLTPPAAGPGDAVQVALAQSTTCSTAFASPSWVALASAVPLVLTGADGNKQVCAIFRDAAGNFNTASFVSGSTLQDLAPPSPALPKFPVSGTLADGTSSATYTATPSVLLDLSGQSDPAPSSGLLWFKVSNRIDLADASWQPWAGSATPIPWTLLPGDGAKNVYVQLQDAAGNISGAIQNALPQITLAGTPPSGGSIGLTTPAQLVNVRSQAVTVSASGAAQMALSVTGFTGPGEPIWQSYASSAVIDLLNGALPAGEQAVSRTVVVSVRFRNSARVEGGSSSFTVTYDHVPPAAPASFSLTGSLGTGAPIPPPAASAAVTSSPAVVASVALPGGSDAISMAFAQSIGTAAQCPASFGTPSWQPYSPSSTFVLTGQNGLKTVCVMLMDAAGNFSTANYAAAALTLDTAPPSNPNFVSLVNGFTHFNFAPADVNGVQQPAPITAATDNLTGVTYQCLGGRNVTWTDCAASGSPLSIGAFELGHYTSGSTFVDQDGAYTLGVRARDDAYNYSSGSFVSVTRDTALPSPPLLAAVIPSQTSVTLKWTGSTTQGITGYLINYGLAPGNTAGIGAAQGPSPVQAGNVTQFNLNGLQPGTPLYLSVVAVDQAGNQSAPSNERVAVPNEVNPRLLSQFGGQIENAGLSGTHVYLGEGQSIAQVDMSNDAAVPAAGWTTLPNSVPDTTSQLPAIPCTWQSVAGDCLYVASLSLAAYYNHLPDHQQVSVVFFPNNGNVSLAGPIATLNDHAKNVFLVKANDGVTYLAALSTDAIRVYSLAAPTAPVLVNTIGPVPAFTSLLSSGVSGNAFYMFGFTSTNTSIPAHLIRVADLLNPASAFVDVGQLKDHAGGDLYTFSNSSLPFQSLPVFTQAGVFMFYAVPNAFGWYDGYVASFAPPTMTPQASQCLIGQTAGCLTAVSGASSWGLIVPQVAASGNLIYGFTSKGAYGNSPMQGWQVATSGLSLTSVANVPFLASGVNDVPFTMVAGQVSGVEHLFALDRTSVHRWKGAGPVTALANDYNEVPSNGVPLAISGHYLFVGQSANNNTGTDLSIYTVDIANPRAPRVVGNYTWGTPRPRAGLPKYKTLKVRDSYLYAGVSGGTGWVDIFLITYTGALSPVAQAKPTGGGADGGEEDIAIGGKYLFAAHGNCGASCTGIYSWDISNPASPAPATVYGGAVNFLTVDADAETLYAAGFNGFQTFPIGTASGSSTVTGLGGNPKYIAVHGSHAFVSDDTVTRVVDVSNPAFPYLDTGSFPGAFPLQGPVLYQGGYVIAPPPTHSDGIRFINASTGNIRGTMPFANCSGGSANASKTGFTYADGVYYIGCRDGGIEAVTPVNPYAGDLLYQSAVAANPGFFDAPMASDGQRMYFGTFASGNLSYPVWTLDLTGSPTGTFQPPGAATVSLTNEAQWFNYRQRTLYNINYSPTAAGVDSLSLKQYYGNPAARNHLALDDKVLSTPKDDGRYLYLAEPSKVVIVDTDDPASMTVASTVPVPASPSGMKFGGAIGVYRTTLYAGMSNTVDSANNLVGQTIGCWDMTYPGGSHGAETSITAVPPNLEIHSIAPFGHFVAYSYRVSNGSPSSSTQQFGLSINSLSGLYDGAGSQLLVSLPLTNEPLGDITIIGDTLMVRANSSLQLWDLTPFLADQTKAPVRLGGQSLPEALRNYSPVTLQVDGPFAHLSGIDIRVFDLR